MEATPAATLNRTSTIACSVLCGEVRGRRKRGVGRSEDGGHGMYEIKRCAL